MKNLDRIIVWALSNGAFLYFAIMGTIYNVEWAYNITYFFVIFFGATCAIAMSSINESKMAPPPPVPKLVDLAYDMTFMGVLAATAHFWLAAVYVIVLMYSQALYIYAEKK